MACTHRTAPHQQFCTLSRFGFPHCRNYGYLRTPRLIILLEDCKRFDRNKPPRLLTPSGNVRSPSQRINAQSQRALLYLPFHPMPYTPGRARSTIRDPRRWIPSCCTTSRHGMGAYCNWTGLLRSGAHYLTPFDASHVDPLEFGPWNSAIRTNSASCPRSLLYLLTSARPSAPHIRRRKAALIGPRMFPFSSQCLGIWRVRRTE
jgi:hypothetical protein